MRQKTPKLIPLRTGKNNNSDWKQWSVPLAVKTICESLRESCSIEDEEEKK